MAINESDYGVVIPMNVKTCDSVRDVITRMNCRDEINIKIDDRKKRGMWFWKMQITVKPRIKHLLPHFERVAKTIGNLYGESLWTKKKGRTLYLS